MSTPILILTAWNKSQCKILLWGLGSSLYLISNIDFYYISYLAGNGGGGGRRQFGCSLGSLTKINVDINLP